MTDALRAAGVRDPLTVIAYVDFDPSGWIAAAGFVKQLARYGYANRRLGYVVRPSRFTKEELDLFSLPLHDTTPQIAGKNRAWLRKSRGIHGEARMIHADHLAPTDRVLAALDAERRRMGR